MKLHFCPRCGMPVFQDGRGRKKVCKSCKPDPLPLAVVKAVRHASSPIYQPHICEECEKVFFPKRTDRRRFCSRECAFKNQHRLGKAICFLHDVEYFIKSPDIKIVSCAYCGMPSKNKYCSIECSIYARRHYSEIDMVRICETCGKLFFVRTSGRTLKYCSDECLKKSESARINRRIGKARRRARRR